MIEEQNLESIGLSVFEMLRKGKFKDIAENYGYALCFDRDAEAAIKDDFKIAVSQCAGDIDTFQAKVKVSRFKPNETGLSYSIECDIQLEQSSGVIVDIILNTKGQFYLEQISSYRKECKA